MPPDRFVTDASLEPLAHDLRFLGYDVALHRGARLEELCEVARRDARIVLTRSVRRPRRFADVRVVTVHADRARALREVANAYAPSGPPFGRCAECNTALARRLAFEAGSEVPPGARRGAEHLHYCPGCGRWYWEGSHVARIRERLAATLGRPLPSAE
ncbi:MAG TPA: Mut7-C RNAse domain-containing protein [Candidatus Saccharimonadaceae bacterium]|nr:Mut7-C RNAse domain-containing protein [Candidatus Saccharimonadaceae bacterium]